MKKPRRVNVSVAAHHYFCQVIAVATMMAGGTRLVDAVASDVRLSDFDEPHGFACGFLLWLRRNGRQVDERAIRGSFYREEHYPTFRGLLEVYESLAKVHPYDPPRSFDEQVASLRRALVDLRRERTALYLWFDADGVLIYLGITGDLAVRQTRHAKRSSWGDFAARSEVRWFPSRAEAEEAERELIHQLRPVFNQVHNDTPEARQRLVDYLVQHGRTDLLAPAISRG